MDKLLKNIPRVHFRLVFAAEKRKSEVLQQVTF